MSNIVDNRVVEMQFDNRNFERNVQTSISTLDKLKQSLNLKGASKGLENVNDAAEKNKMGVLGSAVETVQAKFSALQVIGVTALSNITTAVMNTGAQMAKSLTLDPIIQGFREYETQMGAIQTILANTKSKGSTLGDVTSALDQLNEYADQTIYNFTEMTRNIGTFTAAGVDLDKSVTSIKGIANLAAISGSTSAQASGAMYQLSQALATGKVSLMDWNSVVNAGMGGEVFQTALKRTAKQMGYDVDGIIKKYGSFRDSLTEGQWLTAEVLTETLTQLSGAYTEADLIAQGYTEEQAKQIVDLADTAVKAATEVKTFTQLMETTKEAIGSGWAKTWQIVFGDFEEAKELFTGMSNVITEFVDRTSDARNAMLQEWKDLGGRTIVIEALKNAFDGLLSVIKPIMEAFREIFPPITAQQLLAFSEGLRDLTSKMKLSDENAAKLKDTFKGVFAVVDIVFYAIKTLAGGALELLGSFSGLGGSLLDITSSIGNFLSGLRDGIKESNTFGEVIGSIVGALSGAVEVFKDAGASIASGLGEVFSGLGEIFQNVASIIGQALNNIGDGMQNLFTNFDLSTLANVFSSGALAALFLGIKSFIDQFNSAKRGIFDVLGDFADGITETVSDTLDSVRGSLEDWQNNLKAGLLLKIAAAVGILAASLTVLAAIDKDKLTNALGGITTLFIELIAAMAIFTKFTIGFGQIAAIAIMTGMAHAILVLSFALKNLSSLNIDELKRGVLGVASLTAIVVVAAKTMSTGTGTVMRGAVSLTIFAAAIRVLASSVKYLSSLSWGELAKGLVGVGVLITTINMFLRSARFDPDAYIASLGIAVLSGSLKILALVCKDFAQMDMASIGKGLVGIGGLLAELIVFSRMIRTERLIKAGISIGVLSTSLYILVPCIERLAQLSWSQVVAGLTAIAGSLGSLAVAAMAISDKNLVVLAGAIPAISSSLQIVASAFETLSKLTWSQVIQGLTATVGAIGVLVLAINALPEKNLVATTTALPAITSALIVLAEGMERLGKLSWEDIAQGLVGISGSLLVLIGTMRLIEGKITSAAGLLLLSTTLVVLATAISIIGRSGVVGAVASIVAIAGTLTVVGIAVRVLRPLIPSIFAVSISLTTLAASLLALGIGVAAMGTGLVSLITSFVSAVLLLKDVSLMDIAKGIAAIGTVFAMIGAAARILRPLVPSIISLSGSIALLGLSCIAVSVSISLLIASLSALSAMGEQGAISVVDSLQALILGVAEMIPTVIGALVESTKVLLLGFCSAVAEIAPAIAETLIQVLTSVVGSLSEYAPQIAGFLMDFLIGICNEIGSRIGELTESLCDLLVNAINGLSGKMPEVISALVNLLGSIFVGVVAALGGVIQTIFAPIATIIGDVFSRAIEAIAPHSETLANMFTTIVQIISDSVVKIVEVLAPFTPALSVMVSALSAAVTAIADSIARIFEAIGAQLPALCTMVSTVIKTISDFILGIGGLIVQIIQIVSDTIVGIVEALAPHIPAICEMITTIVTVVTNAIVEIIRTIAPFIPSINQMVTAISIAVVAICNAFISLVEQIAPIIDSITNLVKQLGDSISQIFDSIQDTISTAADGISQVLSSLSDTFDTVFNGIADVIESVGSSIKSVLDGIAGVIDSIGEAALNAGTGFERLAKGVETITNLSLADMAASLAAVATGVGDIASHAGGLGEASGNMQSLITAIASAATIFTMLNLSVTMLNTALSMLGMTSSTAMSMLVTSVTSAATCFTTLVTAANSAALGIQMAIATINAAIASFTLGNLVGTFQNGVGQVSAAVYSMVASVSSALIGMSSLFTAAGYAMMSALNSAFSSGCATSRSILVSAMSAMVAVLMSTVGKFASAANAMMQNLTSRFMVGANRLRAIMTTLMSTLLAIITSKIGAFGNAGSQLVSAFVRGLNTGRGAARSAVSGMMSAATSALNGYYGAFYNAGQYLAQGFAAGINAGSFAASARARAMANAAERAAKEALGIHSPSRVFKQIGKYVPEGFAIGINSMAGIIEKSSVKMADTAINNATSAMARVTDIMDNKTDVQPAITPVIDMDAAVTDISRLNIGADVNAMLGRPVDSLSQIMSDTQAKIEASNREVIDAVKGLRDDLNGYYSADSTEVSLYVDSRKLASSLAKPMNHQLNVLSRRGV